MERHPRDARRNIADLREPMQWNLQKGRIGPLEIGQSRSSVRSTVGEPSRQVPTMSRSDHFDAHGVRVDYDEADRAEFIEVAGPCAAIFAGHNLVGMNLEKALRLFAAAGQRPTYDRDEPHQRFDGVGIALYVGGEDGHSIEAVSVYGAGYYD